MSALTPKERLLAAARGLAVDRAPCISPGGMMNMVVNDAMDLAGSLWPEAHENAVKMARLTGTLAESGGFENYGVPYCLTVEAEGMGAEVDMGSREVEPHVAQAPLTSATQVSLLKPLDLTVGRAAVVLEAIGILKGKGTEIPIIGNLTGPVSLAGSLVDMGMLLMELRKKPQDCHRLLEFIAEQLIAFGNAQVAMGADAVCISDPSGTGEILGAQFFQLYTLTYLNRVLDAIDAPVKIVHICGRLHMVYPLLQEFHCDVFSIDALVSLKEIKPYLRGKAVMGNVSAHALGAMSPAKVRQLTRSALQQGADIVAPACGLPITTPFANIQAMVQASRQGEREL